ncbi:hypothetical protein OJF2_51140 [Aquisphaera giovannonii]|uniref:Uncharacterized protein n=1 Tax=Aquisphaera giovannonii TaxID=406548 RepID=A0A5B9W9L9_9BACT|nr:hypothetical protein [Aquisphaera giovannonii]QEH36530.1 hypothetical protein OJF2_51140 [Aquisphaera giovannonii]
MCGFKDQENLNQADFKRTWPGFSDGARADGRYFLRTRDDSGRPDLKPIGPFPYVLPPEFCEENLYEGIRAASVEYFQRAGIKWHDGVALDARPSNHMRDSQICCVNFFMPFANDQAALTEMLRPLFPTIETVLPIDGQYVAFEWIGGRDYLGEASSGAKRTRGEYYTSADAAILIRHTDGTIQLIVFEWKYTEEESGYRGSGRRKINQVDTRVTDIYRSYYDMADGPFDHSVIQRFEDLFNAPFYQLLRLQLLVREAVRHQELGATMGTLIHVAPSENLATINATCPGLEGDSLANTWRGILRDAGSFVSVTTEALFQGIPLDRLPQLHAWAEYMKARYRFLAAVAP